MNIRARRGEIRLPTKFLNEMLENRDLRESFWSLIVPVRIEHSYMGNCLDIHCYSECFDELKDGVIAPLYTANISQNSNNEVTIYFQKDG